jgi:hypothetical protein
MKTVLAVAAIAALVAAAAWALASSGPASSSYTVEVRDVAGEPTLTVVPEVAVTAAGRMVVPEVVVTSNRMPEVVVRAPAKPELAALPWTGSETVN